MKTQLKRLLALNLALILLLCAALPASAAGTAAQPAQPQQTAQPTEDSTQPQTTAPNPGTHTLTIGGESHTLTGKNDVLKGTNWEASIGENGDGTPTLFVALTDYRGEPIRFNRTGGDGDCIIILNCYGACDVNATDTAAITAGGYKSLAIYAREDASVSFTGKPAVDFSDGHLVFCTKGIRLDGLGGSATSASQYRASDDCSLVELRNQNGVVSVIESHEPEARTVTVKGNGGTNRNGTKDDLLLTCERNGYLDLANAFTQSKKYITHYEDANGKWYSPFLYYHNLEPGNTVLTAFWADCEYEIPAVFYGNGGNWTDVAVYDGSKEWTAPALVPYAVQNSMTGQAYHNTPLCWQNWIDGRISQLLPGQKMPALTSPVAYLGRYTISENGLIFCANGETFENGWVVIQPVNTYQTENRFSATSASGKCLAGWNTEPDGSGTSYAAYGEVVPASHDGLVWLYAQWADPENSVRVRFYAGATGYEEEKWFPRGGQIELPELGEMFGQAQPYWDMQFFRADGSGDRMNQLQSGTKIMIPADAVECRLNAYWIPTESLVIGGQRYTFTRNRTSFSGSGESGDRWTATYNTYAGYLKVWLVDYRGSEISLPASAELTLVESSKNTITAEAGNPAISCRGWLSLSTECSDGKHPSLVASAGAGAPAVTADRVIVDRAPHMDFCAGEGSTVFAGGTPLEVNAYACSFSGVRSGETDTVTLDPDNMPAELSRLLIHPQMYMLSVNGGGTATTPDGKTTASKRVEAGQMASYSALGFSYPGHWCIGYSPSNVVLGNNYEVSIPNGDCAIELHWTETGYDSFLAFRSDYPLADESELKQFYKDNQNTVLFENYASGFAMAPDLKYAQASSGDLLYWYTEAGKMYETDDSQQFLPKESINAKETGIQSGTTLRAVSSGRNGHGFYANGKLFDNGSKSGRKAIAWNNNYAAYWNATDGSQLLCWNTKPDGTGTQYMPGAQLSSDVKKLYAQWVEDGTVPVTLYNNTVSGAERRTVKPGSVFVLPEPSEIADGLRFTQWRCYYLSRSGRYQNLGMIGAGGALTVTEDMVEICATANWLPTGKLTIDGTEYPIDQEHTDYNADMWSVSFYMEQGMFQLDLHGYTGGDISFPCAASVNAADGENRINGTLSCAGTLSIGENCGFGAHPSLTITATDANKPAILMKELRLNRLPHMTLTGGANSKAITSPSGNWHSRVETSDTRYYGKTDSGAQEELITEDENCRRGDMWQLRTVPVMCTVTIDGNGGTTASGASSVTLQLERSEGYSLHSAGFKKQNADLIGIEERGNDLLTNWDNMRIWPQATALTIHLKWKNVGYPYIAFRGVNGILKGEGVPADTNVVYYRNSDTLTVPELVYQDAASSGDLVYWFTSEDGTETADSHCYLPGETVQEPDDTTLYAASIWANKVVLVATGTKFSGWNRMMRADACYALRAEDGRAVESWNTKPDGSGTSYAIDTPAYQIDQSTRVLYAQWGPSFTASAAYDSATGGTKLTIRPATDTVEPPKNTDSKPFLQGVRVVLAAYQNGRFAGMVFAEAKNGVIYCTLPHWLDYRSCELKLFFTEGGKPSRSMEIVRVN